MRGLKEVLSTATNYIRSTPALYRQSLSLKPGGRAPRSDRVSLGALDILVTLDV